MPFLLSQLIEAFRWMGALAVVGLHATNLFLNQADIMSASHAAPVYLWWFLTGFESGHQAVVGFFVLSGYLVGGAVLSRMREPKPFLKDYYLHRVTRVYVVLIPTLLLTLLLDFLGRRLFVSSEIYGGAMFEGHFTSSLLFASLLNLQGIYFNFFGTNGPLWSLACEFWYYITFPLLLIFFAKNYSMRFQVAGFSVGLLLFIFLLTPESWFGFGFILWGMGAFATLAPGALLRSRFFSLMLLASVLILIRLLVRGPAVEAYPLLSRGADLLAAGAFVNLLLAFRDRPNEGFQILKSDWHRIFADFSFSLYAVHMPLLIFMRAASDQVFGAGWVLHLAEAQNYMLAISAISLTLFGAFLFSRVSEAKTAELRRKLRAILT
jgi:peptidoglycan/LPS O-acetylase OafA/YrhL